MYEHCEGWHWFTQQKYHSSLDGMFTMMMMKSFTMIISGDNKQEKLQETKPKSRFVKILNINKLPQEIKPKSVFVKMQNPPNMYIFEPAYMIKSC